MIIFIIIIEKSHNNYCNAGVMESCLVNLLILIDCFLRNYYPYNSYPSIWGKITSFIFLNFAKLQISEVGKFIPNFLLKYVITSTNYQTFFNCRFFLNIFLVCLNLFVLLFLLTPCLIVVVHPCMEWISIKNGYYKRKNKVIIPH